MLNITEEQMSYLTEQLKQVDRDKAKLLFYNMLLDKYSVPKDDPLRSNTHYELSLSELNILLKAHGFRRSIQ